jgi:hypothetical protein
MSGGLHTTLIPNSYPELKSKYPMLQETVRRARLSVNLDAPEGGLDAMMQAMECWDEIGNVIVF